MADTTRVLQPSFAAGELAPSLSGRVDLNKYKSGLKTCRNFFIHRHGGASNRPGFRYVETARGVCRLIPFQFSVEQAYVLEFSNLRIRVLKDRAVVQNPLVDAARWSWTASSVTGAFYLRTNAGANPGIAEPSRVFILGALGTKVASPALVNAASKWSWGDADALGYSTLYVRVGAGTDPDSLTNADDVSTDVLIVTPWTEAMLPAIKYEQSADVLFLVNPSTPPQDLTRTSHYQWTLTAHGTASPHVTSGAALSALYTAPRRAAGTITAITAADPGVVTCTGHGLLDDTRIRISGVVGTMSTLLNGKIFLVDFVDANSFKINDLGGNPVSTAGLTYTSGGTFESPKQTVYYKVVAVTVDGQEGDNTSEVSVAVDLPWASGAEVVLSWTAAVGFTVGGYNVYKTSTNGGSYGFIGFTDTLEFRDNNIQPNADGPQVSRSPFNATNKYPGAVGIFQQRLWFGRTNAQPQTVFGSQTALFSNFSTSDPLRDTDAIEATIASRQVDEIRHLVPLRQMVVFTSGAEWILQSGTGQGGPITPTSISFDTQGYRGCTDVRPIVVGNSALFVQRGGAIVRDLFYNLQDDSLTGNDLSILANHLFKDHYIKDWAYQQSPDSILWAVRDDGILLGLTYIREQEVWAWHRHDTLGTFESIASLPGVDGKPDEVYVVTGRYLANGLFSRSIEVLTERLPNNDVRQGCFLDCSLSYDNPVAVTAVNRSAPTTLTKTSHGLSDGDVVYLSGFYQTPSLAEVPELNGVWAYVKTSGPNAFDLYEMDGTTPIDTTAVAENITGGFFRKGVTTLSGLGHLANKTVTILADGNVLPEQAVSGAGTVTLPRRFATVHVGLPYTCDLESLSLEGGDGQITGRKQRVVSIIARFADTRGIFFGPDVDHLDEMKIRDQEGFFEETGLFTGEKDLQFPGKWERSGRVFFRQPDPLPVTVLLWAPEVELEE